MPEYCTWNERTHLRLTNWEKVLEAGVPADGILRCLHYQEIVERELRICTGTSWTTTSNGRLDIELNK